MDSHDDERRHSNDETVVSSSVGGERTTSGRPTADDLLVERIRAGDEETFCRIHYDHAVSLIRYATTVLGDRDIAEDLVQDVFVWLWKHRANWNPQGSVVSYIYRAVRNRVLDLQRHRDVVARASSELGYAQEISGDRPSLPDEQLILGEQSAALAEAILALPERRRLALIMRAIHDLPYDAIAEALGVTEQAARILVARARETIRLTL